MFMTCVAFPLNVSPQEMNMVDLAKWCDLQNSIQADPKEGLVMILNLEVRIDLKRNAEVKSIINKDRQVAPKRIFSARRSSISND